MDYSFTVTLKPKLYELEPEIQYDLTHQHLCDLLHTLTPQFTLITELTQSMNVHYHGTISLNDKKYFYSKFRSRKSSYGFVLLKPITDCAKWSDYITKSLEETKKVLGRRPVIKDYFDYTTVEQKLEYAITF